MACPVCDRLTAEIALRVREFASALERMELAQETGPAREYADLRDEYSDASLERDLARLAFEKHQRIHRSAAA